MGPLTGWVGKVSVGEGFESCFGHRLSCTRFLLALLQSVLSNSSRAPQFKPKLVLRLAFSFICSYLTVLRNIASLHYIGYYFSNRRVRSSNEINFIDTISIHEAVKKIIYY